MDTASSARAYSTLVHSAVDLVALPRPTRLRTLCDVLWDALSPTGVSWVGFYAAEGEFDAGVTSGESADSARTRRRTTRSLLLECRRDKPACSPISMQGACGRCYLSERPLVVRDVAALGANYVACDPRDRSELVMPVEDHAGVWGVLDMDSWEVGSFTIADAHALASILHAAGLHARGGWPENQIDIVG